MTIAELTKDGPVAAKALRWQDAADEWQRVVS
jgi:hypothetical protein